MHEISELRLGDLLNSGRESSADGSRDQLAFWSAAAATYVAFLGGVLIVGRAELHLTVGLAGLGLAFALLVVSSPKRSSKFNAPHARWILALFLVLPGLLSVWEANRINEDNRDRQQIREAILGAADVQINWFQEPSGDMPEEATDFYLSETEGGGALLQIRRFVRQLVQGESRYDEKSDYAIFFEEIDLQEDQAFVTTFEGWFLPEVDESSGKVVELDEFHIRLIYVLEKTADGWRIRSNPQPEDG